MTRDDLVRFLWARPLLYRAFNNLRFRQDVFDQEFDLLFDGFPRSGNTYGALMLVLSQKNALNVMSRQHKPSYFYRASLTKKPACLTIRQPVDAITSWVIYSNKQIVDVMKYYLFFYEVLLPCRSQFLILPFNVIKDDFPEVIKLINQRFGMKLVVPRDLEACKIAAFKQMDSVWITKDGEVDHMRVPRPDPAREIRKKEVKAEVLLPCYAGLLQRCTNLYQSYEQEFLNYLPREDRVHQENVRLEWLRSQAAS